jgi:hypothetical protein
MNKIVALFSLLFLMASCSSIKPIHSSDQKQAEGQEKLPDQVDFDMNPHHQEKPVEVMPSEETVRIGDRGGDVYAAEAEQGRGQIKKVRIGLSLGPGLYRAINYVSFLKILERQNLSPDIITGTGFGAVIAAMYASGMTPEVIEWNFYKFLREKKRTKPYDAEWVSEIDTAFLSKFRNMNLQDTKKKFFLTLLDHKTMKTYYFDKGNIRDLLLLNLRLSNNIQESKSGQKYTTAFEKEVFNARLLRQLGADFTIAADVLGTKFDFDNSNDFLIGVYGRTAGRIQKEKRDFDYSVTLPLSAMNLDSTKDLPLFMQKSYELMLKQVPVLSRKIQTKLESLSNSGNE